MTVPHRLVQTGFDPAIAASPPAPCIHQWTCWSPPTPARERRRGRRPPNPLDVPGRCECRSFQRRSGSAGRGSPSCPANSPLWREGHAELGICWHRQLGFTQPFSTRPERRAVHLPSPRGARPCGDARDRVHRFCCVFAQCHVRQTFGIRVNAPIRVRWRRCGICRSTTGESCQWINHRRARITPRDRHRRVLSPTEMT